MFKIGDNVQLKSYEIVKKIKSDVLIIEHMKDNFGKSYEIIQISETSNGNTVYRLKNISSCWYDEKWITNRKNNMGLR